MGLGLGFWFGREEKAVGWEGKEAVGAGKESR